MICNYCNINDCGELEYCNDCYYEKLIDLSKLEMLDITKSYLMELIAQELDNLNDDREIEYSKLQEVFDKEFFKKTKISICHYRDTDKNHETLYMLTGYILDKDLPENDLLIKKYILRNYIKLYYDFYNILTIEEIQKMM